MTAQGEGALSNPSGQGASSLFILIEVSPPEAHRRAVDPPPVRDRPSARASALNCRQARGPAQGAQAEGRAARELPLRQRRCIERIARQPLVPGLRRRDLILQPDGDVLARRGCQRLDARDRSGLDGPAGRARQRVARIGQEAPLVALADAAHRAALRPGEELGAQDMRARARLRGQRPATRRHHVLHHVPMPEARRIHHVGPRRARADRPGASHIAAGAVGIDRAAVEGDDPARAHPARIAVPNQGVVRGPGARSRVSTPSPPRRGFAAWGTARMSSSVKCRPGISARANVPIFVIEASQARAAEPIAVISAGPSWSGASPSPSVAVLPRASIPSGPA